MALNLFDRSDRVVSVFGDVEAFLDFCRGFAE